VKYKTDYEVCHYNGVQFLVAIISFFTPKITYDFQI